MNLTFFYFQAIELFKHKMTDVKEEKKMPVVDDKRYAIITRESIKIMAESCGFDDLCDEAAAMLCEDVSYRLKEATQVDN